MDSYMRIGIKELDSLVGMTDDYAKFLTMEEYEILTIIYEKVAKRLEGE